ncbi:MAG: hypothetical protein Tsb0010_08580 [Parvularculaceae bacterium]
MTQLAEYYRRKGFFPSFRNLLTEDDLSRHCAARAALLQEHLKLPRAFFRDARIGEFGPDTGENALAFAKWGADVTLVEPNEAAHDAIRSYFRRFDLEDRLSGVFCDTLEKFEGGPFDLVNAEGFIATVSPPERWLDAMRRLTAADGCFHISYFEARGALIELLTNAAIHADAALNGGGAMGAAQRLMARKWRAAAHSRPLDAWVRDHLESPAARLGAMLRAEDVVRMGLDAGFRLHASAPGYADPLQTAWPKMLTPPEDVIRASKDHIARSALSFVMGAKAYWTGAACGAARLCGAIDRACVAADRVAIRDCADPSEFEALAAALDALAAFVRENAHSFLSDGGIKSGEALICGAARAFRAARGGDGSALQDFCNDNDAFVAHWGTPVHHIVFRKAAP